MGETPMPFPLIWASCLPHGRALHFGLLPVAVRSLLIVDLYPVWSLLTPVSKHLWPSALPHLPPFLERESFLPSFHFFFFSFYVATWSSIPKVSVRLVHEGVSVYLHVQIWVWNMHLLAWNAHHASKAMDLSGMDLESLWALCWKWNWQQRMGEKCH